MTPIGILTKDRVDYLDVTLKSLSATDIPDETPLVVFDDASTHFQTHEYYNTGRFLRTKPKWPKWHESLGIAPVIDEAGFPRGIKGKVEVATLADAPLGVVNGSCAAMTQLFARYPYATGVFLLQDDVIFNHDWYTRMLNIAGDSSNFSGKPLGLLAGLKLNQRLRFSGDPPKVVPSGITAQCIYIPRSAHEVMLPRYTSRTHKITKKFDDTFRRAVGDAGFWAGTIYPYCCQHIGAVSLVRPNKHWNSCPKGRVGFYVDPTYSISRDVRRFPPA